MPYTGRFAPSPTGPLHFGSLIAALASWLDARAAGGAWLLRMEDLDRPREAPGAAQAILRQLTDIGLDWDGEVENQASRTAWYGSALARLSSAGHTYWCACTRAEMADSAIAPDGARIYPGTCRNGMPPGRAPRALRLRTVDAPIGFVDRVQGECTQSVAREVGDFVLLRADGLHAYQLAVVVDDAAQGVTDVVRGADLLDSTARQIHLQRLLGFAEPRYLHVPVAVNAAGEKLAKQTGAPAAGPQDVPAALAFLGHPPPPGVEVRQQLEWARMNWNPARIPRVRTRQVT
jgi:glutamyl-Q tRNA(Asp) synthetase